MKAAEVLKEIMTLGLSLDKFYVSGDAALVLYGIKEEIEEINLFIFSSCFNISLSFKQL